MKKRKLKPIFKEILGIIFIIVIGVIFILILSDRTEFFNKNLEKCGSYYCN